MTVNGALRRALERAQSGGWSMYALADHLELPKHSLYRFVAGTHDLPAAKKEKLLSHFGMRVSRPVRGLKPPRGAMRRRGRPEK